MKSPSRKLAQQTWTRYWSSPAAASPACLPDLPAPLSHLLQDIWETFFHRLLSGSRLLDLGTGSGAVLRLAQNCRPDLRLSGVDCAAALPDLDDAITLYPGTRIETLPFGLRSFDAVTSQFAIEYSPIGAAVKEVARVLISGGPLLFVCHHAGGVVVRDNLPRLAALREFLSPAGLLAAAFKAIRQRQKSSPGTRQRLAKIFAATRRKYPDQAVVHEVGRDLAQLLTEPDSLEKLLSLRRDLAMEAQRLEALRHAALTEDRAREMAAHLSSERTRVSLDLIRVPDTGDPFAWRLSNLA